MDVGFTCDRYGGLSNTQIISVFSWIGIRSFEFSLSIYDEIDRALPLLSNSKVRLHLPNFGGHGYDLSSTAHTKSIASDMRTIDDLCRRIQFTHAVFHPPEGKDTSEELLFNRLSHIPVPLLLENISSLTNKEFQRFYERAKASMGTKLLGICLDVPHAVVGGCDWKDLYAAFDSEVYEIHLSDCMQGKDMHLPFGMGILDLRDILQALDGFGFSGTVNYEINPPLPSHIPLLLKNISLNIPYSDVMNNTCRIKIFLARMMFSLHPCLRRKTINFFTKSLPLLLCNVINIHS